MVLISISDVKILFKRFYGTHGYHIYTGVTLLLLCGLLLTCGGSSNSSSQGGGQGGGSGVDTCGGLTAPGDIYPCCGTGGGNGTGNCTHTAWALAKFNWGLTIQQNFGNANNWATAAATYPHLHVVHTPVPNSIAVSTTINPPNGPDYGHVAWVSAVNPDGTIETFQSACLTDTSGTPIKIVNRDPSQFDAGFIVYDNPISYCCNISGGATLATNLTNPGELVVDNQRIFWVDDDPSFGAVLSVPKAGGAVTQVPGSYILPAGIAVDSAFVYWLERGSSGQGSGALWRTSKGAMDVASPSRMLSGLNNADSQLVSDDQNLYFVQTDLSNSTSTLEALNKWPSTGVWSLTHLINSQTLGTNVLFSNRIALSNNFVYFGTTDGRLMRIGTSGGTPQLITTASPVAIAVSGSMVYWTEISSDQSTWNIKSANTSQSPAVVTTLFSESSHAGGLTLNDLAVDNATLYWIESGYYDEVDSLPTSAIGSTTKTFVAAGGGTGLTINNGEIYWSENDFALQQSVHGKLE